MAAVYRAMGDLRGEVRALTMLVEIAPRDAGGCRSVAVMFAERSDLRRATALLERALELRPEEPFRHIDLAEVRLMAGDHERAARICREALGRDWKKGLSPELMRRMPQWRGTFEARAYSILADALAAVGEDEEAAGARMNVPRGYKRPPLKDAVPTSMMRGWRVRL
jgi:tetratricopeptide (TPR) repeat protein